MPILWVSKAMAVAACPPRRVLHIALKPAKSAARMAARRRVVIPVNRPKRGSDLPPRKASPRG